MAFVKFTKYGASARDYLTIRTNDLLFISDLIIKEFTTGEEFLYASVFIDANDSLMGVKLLTMPTSDGEYRKLSKEKRGLTLNIGCALRFLGIPGLKQKYLAKFYKEDGMICFSVKDLIGG